MNSLHIPSTGASAAKVQRAPRSWWKLWKLQTLVGNSLAAAVIDKSEVRAQAKAGRRYDAPVLVEDGTAETFDGTELPAQLPEG